jgi:RHS repeat-associated protein
MSKGTSAMVAWTFDNRSTDLSGTAELDQTRTHNAANEITDLSGTANDPTHDASGNMTADSSNTYIYDAWNRLVEVRDRSDDSLIAEYEYDGQKRRIEKTVDETETDYFYNDNRQLVEERVDGSVAYEYAWDQRYIDAPVARFDAAGDAVYYTNDANMNVTALVDESGNVVERYAYDPYGERTVLDADWSADADGVSDVDNTLGHQGLHLDTESALYYNRNRYYSPSLGRFTARDPLGYVDGMSVYEYVRSNPMLFGDPSGGVSIAEFALTVSQDLRMDLYVQPQGLHYALSPEGRKTASRQERLNDWACGADILVAADEGDYIGAAARAIGIKPRDVGDIWLNDSVGIFEQDSRQFDSVVYNDASASGGKSDIYGSAGVFPVLFFIFDGTMSLTANAEIKVCLTDVNPACEYAIRGSAQLRDVKVKTRVETHLFSGDIFMCNSLNAHFSFSVEGDGWETVESGSKHEEWKTDDEVSFAVFTSKAMQRVARVDARRDLFWDDLDLEVDYELLARDKS